MKIKKIILVLIVILLSAIILCGCVEGKFHITLNEDGSADTNYRIGFNKTLLGFMSEQENPLKEMRKTAREEGFTVSNYNEGNMIGIIAKKHVKSLDELPKFADLGTKVGTDKTPLVIEEGFFKDKYHFESSVDLSDMKEKPEDNLSGMGDAMLNQVNLRFILTLPFVPENHNASAVRDEGRTLEWHLIPGQDNQITMNASVSNVTNIVLTIIGSVLILVCLVVVIYRKRASKKAEVSDEDNSVVQDNESP
ncbi:MAG: hypothetical protein K9L17_00010 [Clostridiales bacterium]|nr:hypothetical protein [Clostridiales bacterium]MCF8021075.1 hypothetical protein [Clostridiales bacterium]